jgi:hypothetical protein
MSVLSLGGLFLKVIGLVLRIYSYLYHLILSLFLLGLGTITAIGGVHNLNLPMLPWKGAELTHYVLILGIAGLVSVLLAITGVLRYLFPIWCLVVVILMIRGFFLSPFAYSGPDHFRSVVWLVIGAIGALLSSLQLFKSKLALRVR